MKSFRRTDLPRYEAWDEDKTGPGQWDGISGRILGNWSSHSAARAFLAGKRLNYGLGFFADSESLRSRWVRGGYIELEFSARGLFAEKFKRTEFSQANSMSAENVKINATGYSYPDVWSRAEIDIPTPVIEVIALTNIIPDFKAAGLEISGVPFWLAKTGGKPSGPANPWTPGSGQDYTVHYPKGWVQEIQPGDSISRGTGLSFQRLYMTTYRAVWRHQISP